MSDKTCGTCAHFVGEISNRPFGACMESADAKIGSSVFYPQVSEGDRSCGSHLERTESVEKVVRDAVALLDECWREHRRPASVEIGMLSIRLERLGVDV